MKTSHYEKKVFYALPRVGQTTSGSWYHHQQRKKRYNLFDILLFSYHKIKKHPQKR
jgi:hypothetical protein